MKRPHRCDALRGADGGKSGSGRDEGIGQREYYITWMVP
jgi:hypothetical protein